MNKQKRIFIGNSNIAGYYVALGKGFCEAGISTTIFFRSFHKFDYGDGVEVSIPTRIIYFLGRILLLNRDFEFLRRTRFLIFKCLTVIISILYFPYAFLTHDAFIYASGITFFRGIELPLYKIFNKQVIAIFNGSDSRPAYIDPLWRGNNLNYLVNLVKQQKKYINRLENHGVLCINHPPMATLLSKPFIKSLYVGIPKNPSAISEVFNGGKKSKEEVIALHSPSNPLAKGTEIILRIVNELKREGCPIRLVMIKGVPNTEVLEHLKKTDFVIDQIYSDTPMAGLASEAAFLGKPTIVCGDYARNIDNDYSKETIPPSHYVERKYLKEGIRKLVEDKAYRDSLAERANAFVNNNWNGRAVAQKILLIFNGKVPEHWWCNPNDIYDIYPWGVQKEVYRLINGIIENYGVEALQLSDKPILEQKIIKYAKEASKK